MPERKTILSFYCDDTGPYAAGAGAFRIFLDYCRKEKIAGESSVILGQGGKSMTRAPDKEEKEYLKQVKRAWECGIDSHMEIMTHGGLFDFASNRQIEPVRHEGLWLYNHAIPVRDYEDYFGNIIAEGERAGIRFTGLTWPGCGCEVCTSSYDELRAAGKHYPNPNVWQALLNLAKKGRFRTPVVPCFFDTHETDYGANLKASDGRYAVYDVMPNVTEDKLALWGNSPDYVDADYYITADGKSGIVVRHVLAGAPYCLFYAHWQGLNPGNGHGWNAFTTVIDRIKTRLGDRVEWLRPSDIAARYHKGCF